MLSPFDIIFSNFDVVEPDLLYLSNEGMALVMTDRNLQGAPELVIEIGSPATRRRDETIKLRLYERSGVSEYWFVDPKTDAIRVYRRETGHLAHTTELVAADGDSLDTPLLPGLRMPLARIFRI